MEGIIMPPEGQTFQFEKFTGQTATEEMSDNILAQFSLESCCLLCHSILKDSTAVTKQNWGKPS